MLYTRYKMKNKNVPSNRTIVKLEAKSIPLTLKYMTTHFPGLVQILQ